MGQIVFVTGGTRSGKSDVSEKLVAAFGDRVAYVATAQAVGLEMQHRVARHRARRPTSWALLEAPTDLLGAMRSIGSDRDGVMLECLYTWSSNRLLELGDERGDGWAERVAALEDAMLRELDEVVELARTSRWHVVIVSSEVGSGITPERPRQRRFRDLVGRLNERAARLADTALFVVSGFPIDLKKSQADLDALAAKLRG